MQTGQRTGQATRTLRSGSHSLRGGLQKGARGPKILSTALHPNEISADSGAKYDIDQQPCALC